MYCACRWRCIFVDSYLCFRTLLLCVTKVSFCDFALNFILEMPFNVSKKTFKPDNHFLMRWLLLMRTKVFADIWYQCMVQMALHCIYTLKETLKGAHSLFSFTFLELFLLKLTTNLANKQCPIIGLVSNQFILWWGCT